MKRAFISIAVLAVMLTAQAQEKEGRTSSPTATNDTTLVASSANVRFFSETDRTDKVRYYCEIDGKTYESNKTASQRFAITRRFGGTPNVVFITNKKTARRRVSVL